MGPVERRNWGCHSASNAGSAHGGSTEPCPDTPRESTRRRADVQTVRAGPGRPRAASRCCERLSPCLRGQDSQRRGEASPGHASPRTVRPDSSGPTPHLTTLRFKRLRWFVTLSEVFEALGCSILNGRTSKAASPTRPFFGRCHKGPARGVMHTKSPDRQAAEPRVESGHHTACLAA